MTTVGSSPSGSPAPGDAGWAALAQGRWAAARECFEQAIDDQETAEAVEGLSWAGWWLDQADVTFHARERAFHLYRGRGEASGAARMAVWLAVDHLDFHGAEAVAEGWLSRARRLLSGVEPGEESGWLAFLEGYLALARGDTTRAVQRALVTSELGQRCDVPDLQVLGLALQGAALVAAADVAQGMRCLDEAAATALDVDVRIPISSAWACCFLVSACTSVLDYQRAVQWCERIREFAERYGSRYMLGFCRAEYGAVQLWRGEWAQAEMLLEAAVEDFTRSRPAWATAPIVGLAELRRRQGRTADTELLLRSAGPAPSAELCRARVALDDDDGLLAAETAQRLLRRLPRRDAIECCAALDVLVRALIASAQLEGAATALDELRRLAMRAEVGALQGTVDLLAGMLAAARGDHPVARHRLEDAVDRLEAAGGSFEGARARLELAASLTALDRRDLARREARTALETLVRLGAKPEAARARLLLRTLGAQVDAVGAAAVTPRELQVLDLLGEGLTNRQIAERLVVSEHTVHRHVSNLLRKLGVGSRTAAVGEAVRSGLWGSAPT